MAAPIKPQKKTADGRDSYWLVPAIASLAAPTALEVNAATGLNITCFVLSDQEGFAGNTERVTLPRLLCETTTSEGIAQTIYSFPDLRIVFDPQAASGSDAKKAYEKIRNGYTGFLVRRQNIDAMTGDAVVGQFVDAAAVTIAKPVPGKTSTGSDGIYVATAAVAVTDTPEFNVAVV